MNKQGKLLIPVGIVIAILIVGFGAYFLNATNNKQSVQSTIPQETPNATSNTQLSAENSNFIGVTYQLPSGWIASKEEKAINSEVVLEDKSTSRKITIIKNYVGGAAGFKYTGEKEFELNGIMIKKLFYTEDSTTPQTVSMFINYGESPNKYLIVSNWKVGDDDAETVVDEVLKNLSFSK